jgi:hypothetical protein
MRRLFIVLAKLIGLLQVYWGISYLISIPVVYGQMAAMDSTSGFFVVNQVGGFLCYALAAFVMAWLLLARTDWVADKLGIQEDDQLPAVSDEAILKAGVKLVGLYVLVHAVPSLVKSVSDGSSFARGGSWIISRLSFIIPPVFRILLSLLLLVRTERVLSLIARGERTEGKRILSGVLALLALLILIVLATSAFRGDVTRYHSTGSVTRSISEDDADEAEKDRTTSASRDGEILYGQAMPDRSAFSETNIAEIVIQVPVPEHDQASRIRKMGLIDDRKKDDPPVPPAD